jgi:glutamyl endopeptidase
MDGHQSRSNENGPARYTEAALRGINHLPAYAVLDRMPPPNQRVRVTSSLVEAPAPRARPIDAAVPAFGRSSQLEVVLGNDDRQLVSDVTQTPWRHVCALRIQAADGTPFVGTGWFIGPHTVMTAGHCVYLHDHGGWAASIEVIPALDGNRRPFGSATGQRLRAVSGWIDEEDTNNDYGAILLEENLGEKTGWSSFAALSDNELTANVATISGYPADLDRATRQYFHSRNISRVTPRRLQYDIDTVGGQSGSRIFIQSGGEQVAVGIHTTGSSLGNSGTRIVAEVFNNMQRWKNEA